MGSISSIRGIEDAGSDSGDLRKVMLDFLLRSGQAKDARSAGD
jgi:hypothetical protein